MQFKNWLIWLSAGLAGGECFSLTKQDHAHNVCASFQTTLSTMLTPPDLIKTKRATNVSINNALLQKAKSLNINLSATLEAALIEQIASEEGRRWKIDNRGSIADYNAHVESNGCFGDSQRIF